MLDDRTLTAVGYTMKSGIRVYEIDTSGCAWRPVGQLVIAGLPALSHPRAFRSRRVTLSLRPYANGDMLHDHSQTVTSLRPRR